MLVKVMHARLIEHLPASSFPSPSTAAGVYPWPACPAAAIGLSGGSVVDATYLPSRLEIDTARTRRNQGIGMLRLGDETV